MSFALSRDRYVSILLLCVAAILAFLVYSYTTSLQDMSGSQCDGGACGPDDSIACPHAGFLPVQTFFGIGIIILLIALALYFLRQPKGTGTSSLSVDKKILEKLGPEEKQIYDLVISEGGAAFQADIIEKTKISKVRMTRVLDKLEGMGVIERKRRGMSNIVILKHK